MSNTVLEKEKHVNISPFVIKVVKENVDTKALVEKNIITDSDFEMDRRARLAVEAAVAKAKACNKPVARYDAKTGRAYLEYCDGTREYVG